MHTVDNTTQVIECPICRSRHFAPLIDFGTIPRSGTFLESPGIPFASTHLAFEFCTTCALIRKTNRALTASDYESNTRTTQSQLPLYIDEIVDRLNTSPIDKKALIIDVGGNDGGFLQRVAEAGYTHSLNIEPASFLADLSRARGVPVAPLPLTPANARAVVRRQGPAQCVFCRHVLEHVADPRTFLLSLKILLHPQGQLFLEVPDNGTIIHRLRGHELWDEHHYYFSTSNLIDLLTTGGWKISHLDRRPHRGSINMLVWLTAQETSPQAVAGNPRPDLAAWDRFHDRWKHLSLLLRNHSKGWQAPLVCLGASHPQTNFLNYTGIGRRVDYLVDDDPAKTGKYVPVPDPVAVISSGQIVGRIDTIGGEIPPPATVLRTAFGCEPWMDPLCGRLSRRGAIIIDPYELEKML